MARIFLDYALQGDLWTGYMLYKVFFNQESRRVEADFDRVWQIGEPSGVQYAYGEKMHEECFGSDQYQVWKQQLQPFGNVIIVPNAPTCTSTSRKYATYRHSGTTPRLGTSAAQVCGFTGSGMMHWYGNLHVGTKVYIQQGLVAVPMPYSGNGWFRINTSAYQINASGDIISIQEAYCEVVEPLPEPDPLPEPALQASFHLPLAASLTFVKDSGTHFHDQLVPGLLPKKFHQAVKRGQDIKVQWGSSYETNQLQLFGANDMLLGTVSGARVENNLLQELEMPGFAATHPEVSGLQVWFPNWPFPDFAVQGNTVNITGTQISQQAQVIKVDDGKGAAKGYRVMIVNYPLPVTGSIAVTVAGKYNAKPYDVYEAVIDFSSLGEFYCKIAVSDPVFGNTFAISEPIRVISDTEEYCKVTYTNDNDEYGCYYGAGIVHERWIKSRIYQSFPGGEKSLNRETNAKLIKLDEYVTRSFEWEVFQIPPYLVTQLSIALGHDTFKINDVAMQSEEILEPEYYLPYPLANASIRLEDVDFTQNNRDENDGAVDSTDSFLIINQGGRLKIK